MMNGQRISKSGYGVRLESPRQFSVPTPRGQVRAGSLSVENWHQHRHVTNHIASAHSHGNHKVNIRIGRERSKSASSGNTPKKILLNRPKTAVVKFEQNQDSPRCIERPFSSCQAEGRLRDDRAALKAQIVKLEQERSRGLDRISHDMNALLNRDESDLENISIAARPMKITEEFELFCSQEWLEAKTRLDEMDTLRYPIGEKEKCDVLCQIIMKCYEEASQQYETTQQKLKYLILNPVTNFQSRPSHNGNTFPVKADHRITLNMDLEIGFKKELRIQSEKVDMSFLAKDVLNTFLNARPDLSRSLAGSLRMQTYATHALAISWKMILQQPTMSFDVTTMIKKSFDERKAELHFGSKDPRAPDVKVAYYVHPALLHGVAVMRKARVILDVPRSDVCGSTLSFHNR